MTINQALTLLSGIAWTIVYIDSVRIGLKDKTYAMPFWALMLNIAWEFLYSVLGFRTAGPTLQSIINAIWFVLDLGLVYTYVRYGRKDFPAALSPGWFPVWIIAGLVTSLVLQYAFVVQFGILGGATYSAFLQNLLMSVLFIVMLVQRGSSAGQTKLIAVSKWIGTLAPTVLFGALGAGPGGGVNVFVLATGALIAVFDLAYIGLLARVQETERRAEKVALVGTRR